MSRKHAFTVTAEIPEETLLAEWRALRREGYAQSWEDYLREQVKTFLDHASGWWLESSIAYGGRRRSYVR